MKKLVILLFLFPSSAFAESSQAETPWSGEVDFGFIKATGNTRTDSMNGKARVKYSKENWIHTASLVVLNATSNGATTAQSYTFNGKSRHNLARRKYMFGNLQYQDDHLSGYRSQVSETFGYGKRVIDERQLFLDLEVGGGARQSTPRSGPSLNEAIGRAHGNLEWKVSKTSVFSQHLTVESGQYNTELQSITALKSRISGNLAMMVSYTVKYNSFVPAGSVNTETISNVALVLDF